MECVIFIWYYLCATHGAPDGGAVGSNGVLEKDLNLAISLKLQTFLEQSGVAVILTRSDDNGIYSVSESIRNKKYSDMKNREKLIKSSNADAFVSIHMNKFTDEQYSGPQVFFSKNRPESEQLARLVQDNLNACVSPPSPRDIKKADSNIYLLKTAELPAGLVECGFLSNKAEQEKLLNENYQKQIAWAIYCGMIQYFNDK